MEDPSKFFNVIIDRTNQKLNSFQAQIIVLESQLQMANEERDTYKKYVDNLPSINHDVEAFNKLKNDYALLEKQFHAVVDEQKRQHEEAVNALNEQHEEFVNDLNEQREKIVNTLNEQREITIRDLRNSYEVTVTDLKDQLQFALERNSEISEKLKILQSNINDSANFIHNQNETLLQEIKRLKAEMAEMSINK